MICSEDIAKAVRVTPAARSVRPVFSLPFMSPDVARADRDALEMRLYRAHVYGVMRAGVGYVALPSIFCHAEALQHMADIGRDILRRCVKSASRETFWRGYGVKRVEVPDSAALRARDAMSAGVQ